MSPHEHSSLAAVARHLLDAPVGSLHSIHSARSAGRWTTRLEALLDGPEQLLGLHANADWAGIGLVFDGTVGSSGEQLVRFAHVLQRDRSSEVAIIDVGTATPIHAVGPPSGFVADIANRTLGLPCEPELVTPAELLLGDWLSTLLDIRADPSTTDSIGDWADAASLHPVVGDGEGPSPTQLAHLTVAAAQRWPWNRILDCARAGSVRIDGLTPEALEWMDEAFFARWMLGVHRAVTDLVDDLRLFSDGALFDQIQRAVETVEWLGFVPAEKGDG